MAKHTAQVKGRNWLNEINPWKSTGIAMKKSVGLAFSGKCLVAVAIRSTGSQLTLLDSCIVNNELQLDYSQAFTETLQSFVKRNRLRSWPVTLSIPNDWVIVRYMSVPSVPVPAVRQMIQVELGNTIHLPFEDPVFDVATVEPLTVLDEGMQSIALVAAPRHIVMSAIQLVQSVGLRPIAVDIEPIAWMRYAQKVIGQLAGLSVLMDVRETSVSFALFIDDMLYFLREIEGSFTLSVDRNEDVSRLSNDLAYEMDRVMNFFNFSLANRSRIPDRILLFTYVDDGERLATSLAEQIGVSVVPMLSKNRSNESNAWLTEEIDVSLIPAVGLVLRGHM